MPSWPRQQRPLARMSKAITAIAAPPHHGLEASRCPMDHLMNTKSNQHATIAVIDHASQPFENTNSQQADPAHISARPPGTPAPVGSRRPMRSRTSVAAPGSSKGVECWARPRSQWSVSLSPSLMPLPGTAPRCAGHGQMSRGRRPGRPLPAAWLYEQLGIREGADIAHATHAVDGLGHTSRSCRVRCRGASPHS